jgi:hypothetical protein
VFFIAGTTQKRNDFGTPRGDAIELVRTGIALSCWVASAHKRTGVARAGPPAVVTWIRIVENRLGLSNVINVEPVNSLPRAFQVAVPGSAQTMAHAWRVAGLLESSNSLVIVANGTRRTSQSSPSGANRQYRGGRSMAVLQLVRPSPPSPAPST